MDIILAMRNPSKILQTQSFFLGSSLSLRTQVEAGITGQAKEEGGTLEENAIEKALLAYEGSGRTACTMADDTGIFINALRGEPGVRSARWAGEDASTEETMQYCLRRLKGVSDRSATFRTVVAVISPSGVPHLFRGEVTGHLLEAPRVPPKPNMPYSSLFVADGQERSWAEMTTEEENRISHRGKAFQQVKLFFAREVTAGRI